MGASNVQYGSALALAFVTVHVDPENYIQRGGLPVHLDLEVSQHGFALFGSLDRRGARFQQVRSELTLERLYTMLPSSRMAVPNKKSTASRNPGWR